FNDRFKLLAGGHLSTASRFSRLPTNESTMATMSSRRISDGNIRSRESTINRLAVSSSRTRFSMSHLRREEGRPDDPGGFRPQVRPGQIDSVWGVYPVARAARALTARAGGHNPA